jgi:hypothetical protein
VRTVKLANAGVFRGDARAGHDSLKVGETVHVQTTGGEERRILDHAAFENDGLPRRPPSESPDEPKRGVADVGEGVNRVSDTGAHRQTALGPCAAGTADSLIKAMVLFVRIAMELRSLSMPAPDAMPPW